MIDACAALAKQHVFGSKAAPQPRGDANTVKVEATTESDAPLSDPNHDAIVKLEGAGLSGWLQPVGVKKEEDLDGGGPFAVKEEEKKDMKDVKPAGRILVVVGYVVEGYIHWTQTSDDRSPLPQYLLDWEGAYRQGYSTSAVFQDLR